MEEYLINKYDAKRLFLGGVKNDQDKCIECSEQIINFALIIQDDEIRKQHSLLTTQLVNMGKEGEIHKIIIELDFSSWINEDFDEIINNFENGIVFKYEDKEIRYIDFFKSQSMTKESCIFYVDEKYYNELYNRTTLGLEPNKAIISKWYAYSGLVVSQCQRICENVKLNYENVVIVKDLEKERVVDCITAISLPSISNYIDDILNIAKDSKEKFCDFAKDFFKILYSTKESVEINLNEDEKALGDVVNELLSYQDYTYKEVKPLLERIKSNIKIEDKVYWKDIVVKGFKTKTNVFDGEGLCSINLKNKICKDNEDYASFQIRLPFMKGVVHSCDFKKFFKEKGKTTIKGIIPIKEGYLTKEYDIEKVELILTESQFKGLSYLKELNEEKVKEVGAENALEYYFKKINEYDYHLGISRLDSNKSKANLNAQILSTLPLGKDDLDTLCKNTEEFLYSNNPQKVLDYAGEYYTFDKQVFDKDPKFYTATRRYVALRKRINTRILNDATVGIMPINGDVRFLSNDLLELLYYICDGKNYNKKFIPMSKNSYYSPKRNKNDVGGKAILLRNPHYSRNEIVVANRIDINKNIEREKYFGHLFGTVMVDNESLSSERLGGADYDGDTVIFLENNGSIAEVVENVYGRIIDNNEYIYPLAKIPSLTTDKVLINFKNKTLCLKRTADARIGLISNQAIAVACDYYTWNFDNDLRLDSKMAFYTICSGLEIDSAKSGSKPVLPLKDNNKWKKTSAGERYLRNKTINSEKQDYTTFSNIEELRRNSLYKKIDNEEQINSNLAYIQKKFEDFVVPTKTPPEKCYKQKFLSGIKKVDVSRDIRDIIDIYKTLCEKIKNDKLIEGYFLNINFASEKIKDILDKNGNEIEFSHLYDEFIDIYGSKKRFERYVKGIKKFHFLDERDKKEEYIRKLFGLILIDKQILDTLCNFNNEGFKVLFLLLLIKASNESINEQEKKIIDECKWGDELKYYLNGRRLTQSKVNDFMKEYIKKHNVQISLNDIYSFDPKRFNVFDSATYFTAFSEQLKMYLEI